MGSLTSENGKLCIDGAVLEPDADSNMIYWPEGNYYLAENVTVANAIEIRGVVNLCLNGHTLNTGEKCIDVRKTTNGTAMGNLSLCDCGEGGTITGEFCGASNSYALISVGNEFSMYGGKVINAGDNNQQYSQAVSAFGGTVKLFGGEIVSLDDNAFFVGGSTGGLHLSGAPKIKGAANRVDIYLKNGYYDKTITLDAPITNTEPYRVGAESSKVFTSGWNTKMADAAFSDYFIAEKSKFIAKDENELKIYEYAITQQPSEENDYTVTVVGEPTGYQWYSSDNDEAVSGQTSSRFTGNADGKYYCMVTYADGTAVKSAEIDYKYTTPPPSEHKHDMSAECGHDNDVTFDSAITLDTDGKLYVNGTEIEAQTSITGSVYNLGEGNFYLAGDVNFSTGKNYLKLNGNANLCLNGHTTNATINIDQKNNVGGVLNMCDCDEKKLGTIDATNNSGDIMNNKDGVQLENAASESVKNTFNMYGGNIYNAYRGVVALSGGNFNMYGGKVTGGSTAVFAWCPIHLYGGEISGAETGISMHSPVYLHNGAVIKNNTVDLLWSGSSSNTVTIDGYTPADGYKLTVDCENMSEPFDITAAANTDYSGYFEESDSIKTDGLWKIKNSGEGANQVVQLTDAENLSITKGGVTSYYATLERAFANAADGDTIKVEKDYTEVTAASLEGEKEITLDLNEKHISVQDSDPVMLGTEEGKLTIKGNGTFDGIIMHMGGELVIENGTFGYLFISSPEGVTLNGGTFKGGKYSESTSSSGILLQIAGYNEDTSKTKLEAALGTNKKFNKEIKTSTASVGEDTLSAAYFDGEVKVLDISTSSPSPSTSPAATPSTSPAATPSTSPAATPSTSPAATPTAKPRRKGGSSVKTTPAPAKTPAATPSPSPSATDIPASTQKPSDTDASKQHKAYIMGYEGMFEPDKSITRAETTAILARLTEGFDEDGGYTTSFTDVADNLWYHKYIGFMESRNIIEGYSDGTFKPEDNITRAEFASVITRFTGTDGNSADAPFTDIGGHWAQNAISACFAANYISGYEDNLFLPDNDVTRAEVIAVINRVLGRDDIKDFENPFSDVYQSHWAYKDIMEAAVPHSAE